MRGRFHHLTQNLSTVCEFANIWGAHAAHVPFHLGNQKFVGHGGTYKE